MAGAFGRATDHYDVSVAIARDRLGSGAGPIAPGEMKMTARLQVVYAIAGPAGD